MRIGSGSQQSPTERKGQHALKGIIAFELCSSDDA